MLGGAADRGNAHSHRLMTNEIGKPDTQLVPQIISLYKCNINELIVETPVY